MSPDARVALAVYVLVGGMLIVIALGADTWSRRPQYGHPPRIYRTLDGDYRTESGQTSECYRAVALTC